MGMRTAAVCMNSGGEGEGNGSVEVSNLCILVSVCRNVI